MKILYNIKISFVSIVLLILLSISIIYAIRNTIAVNANFYIGNISIREIFYLDNNSNFKGTHEPSKRFNNLIVENYSLLKTLNLEKIIKKLKKIQNLDINSTEYYLEKELFKTLKKISRMPISEKRISGLFIPKNIKVYWNLSCDIYMTPFIAPAITNIVMINGLPNNNNKSCYGHSREYGYARYLEFKKYFNSSNFNKNIICKNIIKEGLQKVILIKQIKNEFFETEIYNCLDN